MTIFKRYLFLFIACFSVAGSSLLHGIRTFDETFEIYPMAVFIAHEVKKQECAPEENSAENIETDQAHSLTRIRLWVISFFAVDSLKTEEQNHKELCKKLAQEAQQRNVEIRTPGFQKSQLEKEQQRCENAIQKNGSVE